MEFLGFILLIVGILKLIVLQVVLDLIVVTDMSVNEAKGIVYFWIVDSVLEIFLGVYTWQFI